MPFSDEESHGLQLWVNLKSKDKLCDPQYQELKDVDVPKADKDGIWANVIAGTALGTDSPVYTRTPTHYVHYRMQPGKTLNHKIPAEWNSFIYTLGGKASIGAPGASQVVEPHHTVTLTKAPDAEGITITTQDEPADFVLLAGEPCGEPVVQHGPFVMNTREQIMQAMMDYQSGQNGFEGAGRWYSQIGLPITHADRR